MKRLDLTTFFAYIMIVLALVFSTAACQTVEGMGEDIQDAGDAIEDAAEDASD